MAKEVQTPAQAPKFTRKAQVTADVLKMEVDRPYFIQILSAIEQSKAHQEDDGKKNKDGQDMEPALICRVKDLEFPDSPEFVLIVNSVLNGILTEQYVNKETGEVTYVGKGFEVTKRAKASGKRYHTFQVFEIEL